MTLAAAISVFVRFPARFARAMVLFCLGGHDAILRSARAHAHIVELEAEQKKLEIEKLRALYLLYVSAKIERIKDADQREALRMAIFRRSPPVALEAPREFFPER